VTFATLPRRAILAGSLIRLAAAMADAYDVSGFLAHKELKAVNAQFSLRGPRTPHAPVVIVTIDEESGKPAVIALDILFIEPSSRGPADDQALAQAISRSGRVVLAAGLSEVLESGWIQKLEKIQTPLPEIRAAAAAWGPVNVITDRDAFVRRDRLTIDFQDREYPGFDPQIYGFAKSAGIPAAPLPDIGDTINLGSRHESITKGFNVPVVISEATWLEVNSLFETRYLGEVTVKGKEIPVKIYTVVGPPAWLAAWARYHDLLTAGC
jgi:CHASE2 domain-containing sensor protein